jgi:preprotein translocase subunit YajC
MDFFISNAYAQAPGPAASGAPGGMITIIYFVVIIGVVFFMFRSQMKRAKEQRSMVSQLAKGDEVVTNSGILGRIDDISDSFLTLEVAPNVKLKFQKQAIAALLPKGTLKSA